MILHGNTVLITGATEGIGKALAQKFIGLNNTVIAVGRNKQRLAELATIGHRLIPLAYDLSKHEDLEQLSRTVASQHKAVNILINNAGVQYNYNFSEEQDLVNKIEHELNVNLLAPLKLTALLLPLLEQNQNAAIVNVSSGLALVPKMQAPVYCGTKAGLHIFSKSLRYQLKHVKVFEIIPPLVDTNMTKGRGKGKISAEQLVEEFVAAFARNRYEVSIGKVKLLKWINRLSPALAERIMKNG